MEYGYLISDIYFRMDGVTCCCKMVGQFQRNCHVVCETVGT